MCRARSVPRAGTQELSMVSAHEAPTKPTFIEALRIHDPGPWQRRDVLALCSQVLCSILVGRAGWAQHPCQGKTGRGVGRKMSLRHRAEPSAEPWLPAKQGWQMAAACVSQAHGPTTRAAGDGTAPAGNHSTSLSSSWLWGPLRGHNAFLPCALWNSAAKAENMT